MTQSLRLIPVEAGWLTSDQGTLSEGHSGEAEMPVSCWVIEHPKGRVLFDSGLHVDLLESSERLGAAASLFKVAMKGGLDAQLEAAGVDPASIDILVFSHLHWDHSGGTHAIPNARLLVQKKEWASASEDDGAMRGYNRKDFDLGHDVVKLEGEHDIFGDGTVVCVPTPGHTAGHQSLRVMLESGPVLLVGDCCYWEEMLEKMILPPFGYDKQEQLRSMEKLKAMREAGAVLFFGHDRAQWLSLGGKVLT